MEPIETKGRYAEGEPMETWILERAPDVGPGDFVCKSDDRGTRYAVVGLRRVMGHSDCQNECESPGDYRMLVRRA